MTSTSLILLVVLVLVEIVGRSFFDYSTMIADEYSGYLYLSIVFFGLAYGLNTDSHIRITIITSRVSEEANRWIDIVAGTLGLIVMGTVIFYAWELVLDTKLMDMVSEGVSETPLYLTQIPMVVGSVLLFIALLSFTLERIAHDR
ncbi:MAG: TRAP transporter small permease [Marichromatium sp.]|nr:TRAP transporter small permease [Marichromatium sp.]